jgi:L-iditol 2-dehydrogenase
MLAAQLTGIRQMEINNVPAPSPDPGPGEALVRVKAIGVCGSDVHNYLEGGIGTRKVAYPFIPGHEASGEVIAVGAGVKEVSPGDRVMIEPAMHCGQCDQCRVGRFNTCRKIQFLSSAGELQGCMCERITVPVHNCFRFPDGMSFEQAAAAEPLSIAVYSVKKSIPMSADTPVAILGCGPIGLCTLLAVLQAGAKRVYMTDRIPERLALAKRLGACWTGRPDEAAVEVQLIRQEPLGFPVVFECCGKQEAIDQGTRLLRPGGMLVITGIPEGSRISLCIDILRRNELTVYNVRRQNQCVKSALAMIADGTIDVAPLITHRFPLAQAKRAFELVADYADGVVKAMVTNS